MKHLHILICILILRTLNSIYAYDFDFINLTDNRVNLAWGVGGADPYEAGIDNSCGDNTSCSNYARGNLSLNPGSHRTVSISGFWVAGDCMTRIALHNSKVNDWTGSVCRNRGFRITDDGIHEGSDVSLHTFSIQNNSQTIFDLDLKLFLVNSAGNGKSGPQEYKLKFGYIPKKITEAIGIPKLVVGNVYKINFLRLTNIDSKMVSTFAGLPFDKDMEFFVQIDPATKEPYLAADNKRYDSLESYGRIGQKRMESAIKRAQSEEENK